VPLPRGITPRGHVCPPLLLRDHGVAKGVMLSHRNFIANIEQQMGGSPRASKQGEWASLTAPLLCAPVL